MTGLDNAILGLERALQSPRRHQMWRWLVRQRMSGVKEALDVEGARGGEAWLAAREGSLQRERQQLLSRIAALGPPVLDAPDLEPVREEVLRLLHDLERHSQRVNDLVYDAVSLELGGSE